MLLLILKEAFMKIILFLADGFEEVEALTVVDYLRRMEIEVDMVSISDDRKVKGAHDIEVLSDKILADIGDIESYDGLVIPGGMPGASNLRNNDRIIEIVRTMNQEEKLVAAICAGPIVFERANIIENKKITSYPGFEDDLKDGEYINQAVVLDGNMITARGPAYAVDFAIEIVRYLLNDSKADELKKDILYKEM